MRTRLGGAQGRGRRPHTATQRRAAPAPRAALSTERGRPPGTEPLRPDRSCPAPLTAQADHLTSASRRLRVSEGRSPEIPQAVRALQWTRGGAGRKDRIPAEQQSTAKLARSPADRPAPFPALSFPAGTCPLTSTGPHETCNQGNQGQRQLVLGSPPSLSPGPPPLRLPREPGRPSPALPLPLLG